MMEHWVRMGFGVISSFTAFLFGDWNLLIQFLLIAQFLDVFSGLIAGGVNGELSSKVGRSGIARKVMVWFMVGIGQLTDLLLKDQGMEFFQIEIEFPIRSLIIVFYLANEILSIFENADRTGLNTPLFLKKMFESMREKSNEGNKK